MPPQRHVPLGAILRKATSDDEKIIVDFIGSCLRFNPKERCSAEALLAHAFVSDFHNEKDEPNYPYGSIQVAIDDNLKLSAQDYRANLYSEIQQMRKKRRAAAAAAAPGDP